MVRTLRATELNFTELLDLWSPAQYNLPHQNLFLILSVPRDLAL
jgi:hypothetical protein